MPGVSPGHCDERPGWLVGAVVTGSNRGGALDLTPIGVPMAAPTNGARATVGVGLTFFSDMIHVGVARPVDRAAPWRFVAGFGTAF